MDLALTLGMDARTLFAALFLTGIGFLLRKYFFAETTSKIENSNYSEETNASWDEVDQAAWESFPASDPPPWR